MVYILEKNSNRLLEAKIVLAEKNEIPLKKDGWNFNWRQLSKEGETRLYILKLIRSDRSVEGAMLLKIAEGMLIMDVLEVAPYNIRKTKRYDYVAGSLIAFACRESFKLEGNYKGFLTFVSKTELIDWYIEKYGAELALGQKMFIDWENGNKLIEKYLNRKGDKNE